MEGPQLHKKAFEVQDIDLKTFALTYREHLRKNDKIVKQQRLSYTKLFLAREAAVEAKGLFS